MPPSANVLIVCGLKGEAAIIAGPGRATLCGDAPTLRAGLAQMSSPGPSLVVSWGLCGGLDPRLRPGDLILGAEVVSNDGAIRTDEAVTSSLAQRLLAAGTRVVIERVTAADAPVLTAQAKADLRRATEAAAVDMESLTAGRFALKQRVPFVTLRAVSDPAERDLPPAASKAMDPDGGINLGAVIRELIRSPGQLAGLGAAALDSRAAFRTLQRCRSLLPGLFLGLGAADIR
ncbi:MAG TPA: phosphorylase [Roseiarcus sp.]